MGQFETHVRHALSRAQTATRILRNDGGHVFAQRLARLAYERMGAASLEFPLLPGDVADSASLDLQVPDPVAERRPLRIGWICAPPGSTSGGHTTMFRLVEGLESAGHTCVVYLYDRFGGDLAAQTEVIRSSWPGVKADIRSVADGLAPLDGYVATSWQSAHVLARKGKTPTRRFYLVQDFEPYFYPRGSEYCLAEDTYRFGYRVITIGPMLAQMLSAEFGIKCDVAEFGCDTDVYSYEGRQQRTGVVFYAKPGVARRGFALSTLALEEFHRRHPDQEIHMFGDPAARLPFPATPHGLVTPHQLADLYNSAIAGLALSFTNMSLVPDEMLACGAIPVVNDMPGARLNLPNKHVRWTPPTPMSLADGLSAAVSAPDIPERAAEAAASVRSGHWEPARRAIVAAVEAEVYGTRGQESGTGLDG